MKKAFTWVWYWRAGNSSAEAWRRKADLAHFCVVTGWLLCSTIFSVLASETAVWNLWHQLCVHSDRHSTLPTHTRTRTPAGRQVFIMNRMCMFHLAYSCRSFCVKCVIWSFCLIVWLLVGIFFLNNLYFMIVSEILDGRDFKKSPCQDEKDVILSGL